MRKRLVDYRDRVAFITGASSGIGEQLARDLAARGARVAVLARRAERLHALAAALGGPERALVLPADVADSQAVGRAVAATRERFGRLDIVVNAAGVARHVLFKDHDLADIEHMVRTNLLGTIYVLKAAIPALRAGGGGWIVNVSSVAGKLGQPDEAVYSATKFGVSGLSEGIAYELAPLGIHVLTVYPALVRTEMFTPEILARMPERAKRTFMETPAFCAAVLRALERGAYEVTVPSYVGIAYLLRAVLPALHRRIMRNLRLPVLPDLER
jgi:short-subunit dehydrogenase